MSKILIALNYCKDGEHYFSSHHLPNFKIWIVKCSLCDYYDTDDMNKQLEALLAKQVLAARINEAAWWTKNYKNHLYKDLLINRLATLNKKESQE